MKKNLRGVLALVVAATSVVAGPAVELDLDPAREPVPHVMHVRRRDHEA